VEGLAGDLRVEVRLRSVSRGHLTAQRLYADIFYGINNAHRITDFINQN
jgi:hypothetical protein